MAVDWQILYKHADLGKNARVLNYRFIGGGYQNCMDTTTGGGTQFNVIGGGFQNKVCVDAFFSSIFSGEQNCVQGQYSAILGGSGNFDNGFNYVGIFGQGVNGVISNAFHAENYVAQNIPYYSGSGPLPVPVGSRALYYQVTALGNAVFVA